MLHGCWNKDVKRAGSFLHFEGRGNIVDLNITNAYYTYFALILQNISHSYEKSYHQNLRDGKYEAEVTYNVICLMDNSPT